MASWVIRRCVVNNAGIGGFTTLHLDRLIGCVTDPRTNLANTNHTNTFRMSLPLSVSTSMYPNTFYKSPVGQFFDPQNNIFTRPGPPPRQLRSRNPLGRCRVGDQHLDSKDPTTAFQSGRCLVSTSRVHEPRRLIDHVAGLSRWIYYG